MAYLQTNITKVTTRVLQNMKTQGEKIAMLTAYDYSMATLLDKAQIDVILVGDGAGGRGQSHDQNQDEGKCQYFFHYNPPNIKICVLLLGMPADEFRCKHSKAGQYEQITTENILYFEA